MKAKKYILLGLSICLVLSGYAQKGRKANNGWTSIGPSNIQGRALTLCVDNTNSSKLYAGAAGSGLWISPNGGATWNRISAFQGSAAVSAIIQDNSGALYVGTGDALLGSSNGYTTPGVSDNYNSWGIKGDGIYKSTDGGATFTQLSSTSDWEAVNSMAYDATNNKIYVAGEAGLMVSADGGNSFSMVSAQSLKCTDVKVGDNGMIVYTDRGTAAGAYVSTDGGATFTSVCGTSSTKLPKDAGRISLAISKSCPDMLYAVVASTSGTFVGVYQSRDKGTTWRPICPTGGLIDIIGGNNGMSCLQIEVSPTDSSKVFVGGRAFYYGTEYSTEQNFNWNSISINMYLYDIVMHDSDMYLCTRTGIYKSTNGGSFAPKNNYFATMQSYTLAIANDGRFMSGIKDGGIAYIANPTNSTKQAVEINTPQGDGGNCAFSFIKSEALFYTGYYGYVYRQASASSDAQTPVEWFGNNEEATTLMAKNGTHTRWYPDDNFMTNTYASARINPIVLWENPTDYNSIDSVDFIIDKTYVTGDKICVKSKRNGYPIWYEYTGTDTLYRNEDTIRVQDIVTSRFFLGGGGHKYSTGATVAVGAPVYMSTTHLDYANIPSFTCVFRTEDSTEQVIDLQVSKDGNNLYVLTRKYASGYSYCIYRVSGFDTYRELEQIDVSKHVYDPSAGLTTPNDRRMLVDDTLLYAETGVDILSISLDPSDNDVLVYTTNGDGVGYTHINAITNASTATRNDVNIEMKEGSGIPEGIAVYTALIEMNNSDLCYIGTEVGIYKTENFTSSEPTWTLYNDGIGVKVPVFKLLQQTHFQMDAKSVTYSADGQAVEVEFPGVSNYGNIYAATYGLGIFIDSTYYDAIESPRMTNNQADNNLFIYPNPTKSQATVVFNIQTEAQTTLNIIDITGRTISSRNLGQLSEGSYQETIDCSGLANGLYFINIKNNTTNRTSKLIIHK